MAFEELQKSKDTRADGYQDVKNYMYMVQLFTYSY